MASFIVPPHAGLHHHHHYTTGGVERPARVNLESVDHTSDSNDAPSSLGESSSINSATGNRIPQFEQHLTRQKSHLELAHDGLAALIAAETPDVVRDAAHSSATMFMAQRSSSPAFNQPKADTSGSNMSTGGAPDPQTKFIQRLSPALKHRTISDPHRHPTDDGPLHNKPSMLSHYIPLTNLHYPTSPSTRPHPITTGLPLNVDAHAKRSETGWLSPGSSTSVSRR